MVRCVVSLTASETSKTQSSGISALRNLALTPSCHVREGDPRSTALSSHFEEVLQLRESIERLPMTCEEYSFLANWLTSAWTHLTRAEHGVAAYVMDQVRRRIAGRYDPFVMAEELPAEASAAIDS